jgi:hypothetical protein
VQRYREREQLGTTVARGYLAEQGVGVGIIDDDRQEMADLAGIAVEDGDAVAVSAAGELRSSRRLAC